MSYRTQQAPDEAVRQLPVVNTTGEDVPAFALMHITGVDADGALLVGQPSVDGQTSLLVNGPVPIPPGAHGQGHSASPAAVLYDDADGTPAAGETWGAAAGSWKARKGKAGALVVGGTDAVARLTNVLHLWGLAPAGSTPLTAREVDGSPSVSPVTVIEFDQVTGLKVTDQAGGVARVENVDASETQTGVINTTDQTLLGWKDFKTGVLVGRVNGPGALTAEIHFHAFPGSDAREQSRIRVVEDVNHAGGDYQTMILTAGFGSSNYGAEKSAELWVDGENQCFRLYAWTGSSLVHKRPDLFIFNDGGLEVQGQTVTDSGVTYTSGVRTGGTLAVSLTGAVTGSLSGGSIATTYAGTLDGGAY